MRHLLLAIVMWTSVYLHKLTWLQRHHMVQSYGTTVVCLVRHWTKYCYAALECIYFYISQNVCVDICTYIICMCVLPKCCKCFVLIGFSMVVCILPNVCDYSIRGFCFLTITNTVVMTSFEHRTLSCPARPHRRGSWRWNYIMKGIHFFCLSFLIPISRCPWKVPDQH